MNKTESNRLNALKSTGPKTPEGKAASSMNAVKHGAYSEAVVSLGETREDFDGLRASLEASLIPEGALEEKLVDRLASLWWRIERAGRAEREGLRAMLSRVDRKRQVDTFETMAHYMVEGWMERLSRYEGQLERSFFRTMHELERIQARRQGGGVLPPAVVDISVHGVQE
jgi:hypothetical protein